MQAGREGKAIARVYAVGVLHDRKIVGFHAFRRFRLTWLRKNVFRRTWNTIGSLNRHCCGATSSWTGTAVNR